MIDFVDLLHELRYLSQELLLVVIHKCIEVNAVLPAGEERFAVVAPSKHKSAPSSLVIHWVKTLTPSGLSSPPPSLRDED